MSYFVTHRYGDMERDFPICRFGELLDELSDVDDEHPDVAVTHESEWSLSILGSGFVCLENVEEDDCPVHMGPLDRQTTLRLMVAVAEGRIEEARSEPWRPGYR